VIFAEESVAALLCRIHSDETTCMLAVCGETAPKSLPRSATNSACMA